MNEKKINLLYIHGFNGKSQGGTYVALKSLAEGFGINVLTHQFRELHTNVEKTQGEIERLCRDNDIRIIAGASLGGFYALQCRLPLKKIAINPCLLPSAEIPLLKNFDTGENVFVPESVIEKWRELERWLVVPNAFGIFGRQDDLFHNGAERNFKSMFDSLFKESSESVLVNGKHSLELDELRPGFFAAMEHFKIEGRVQN